MVDTPIGGNSPNYTLVPGDVGATIFCRVTASNASGSAQAFSNAVGPVVAAGGGDVTAPTITSSATVSNAENSTLAHTLTANETVTWSKIGGADTAKFTLTGAVLSWTSGTKNFEAPDDADANNAYIVQVRATDTVSNTTDQTITVTVTNVVDESAPAMTNLWTWLKADAGTYGDAGLTTPVSANGAIVNGWDDQSPGDHNYFEAPGGDTGPTLVTNALNSKPVLQFSGSQHFLGPSAAALTAGEVFIVVKADTDATAPPQTQNTLWEFDGAANGILYPYGATGQIYDGWGRSTRPPTGVPALPLTAWRLYNVVSTPSEWTSFLDNVQHYTTATNTVSFATTTQLGAWQLQGFPGMIAEFIMYSVKCSAPDKLQTVTYLSNKYALGIV